MKRILFLLFSLSACFLNALESTDSTSLLNVDEPKEVEIGPFKIKMQYLSSSKADFKDDTISDQHSTYEKGLAEVSYTLKGRRGNGLFYSLGYQHTRLKWEENPSFTKDNFSYVSLGVGGFNVNSVDRWTFLGGAQVEFDPHEWSIRHYSLAFLMAKARYAFNDDFGMHIGALGQFGLEKNQFFPVLGVDYQLNQWAFYCIFPQKIAVEYTFDEHWKVALQGKVFRSRHRVGSDEPEPKAVFEYRSAGVGLAASYVIKDRFSAQIMSGYKTAGDLKIMDKTGNNPQYHKFKGSWYYGGEISYTF